MRHFMSHLQLLRTMKKSVCLFLKSYRNVHNLTQKEAAYRINISREHYSRLESGKLYPSECLIDKIKSAIGANLIDIIQKTEGDIIDMDV